jgi:hypothetical protein
VALAVLAVPVSAVAPAPVASAATASKPPTISSSFTPGVIGVGGTSSIGFSVTNPNASGTLTAVGFTDTITGGVIDNPSGQSLSGCGSVVVTSNPGTTTITVSGASVKAGTPCVISIAVTAATAEAVTSQTGTVSSSAGSSASGSQASLTVLELPTVTATAPAAGAKYKFGQKVIIGYSCVQAAYALGLEGCTAQDDLGNTIATGAQLDTKIPGKHQLTIQATSISGVTDQTIDYTVLPDNRFKIGKLNSSGTKISFKLGLPGAGTLRITELAGKDTVVTVKVTVHRKRSVTITLVPDTKGQALLQSSHAKVELVVVYTPKRGVARTKRKHA